MLFRTMLFVPSNSPKMLLKADSMKADCVIFDLEDGVPSEKKAEARIMLNEFLSSGLSSCRCLIRVNDVNGEEFRKDIEAIKDLPFDGLYLPKVEHAGDVKKAEQFLDGIDPERKRCIFNTVETPLGVENEFECLTASDRVAGAVLGSEDYAVNLGVRRSENYYELEYARMRLVNVAKAVGKMAIDTVYADVNNEEGLVKETLKGKLLGYDGKAVLSPAQVAVVHRVYTPDEEEYGSALKIVNALKDAEAEGKGIATLNGKMIDRPVALQAAKIIELYENSRI